MTPEQFLIKAIDDYRGDDLERARRSFRGLSDAEMDKPYGQSGHTYRQILQQYEKHDELWKRAKALLMEKLGRTL